MAENKGDKTYDLVGTVDKNVLLVFSILI